jgi:hypothetical protein
VKTLRLLERERKKLQRKLEMWFAGSLGWRRILTSAGLLRGTLLQLAMVCLLKAIFPRWLALALLVVLVSYVMDGRLAWLRGYENRFIRRYRRKCLNF